MVCGAVKREHAHVEPLTPLLPMLPGYGIEGRQGNSHIAFKV